MAYNSGEDFTDPSEWDPGKVLESLATDQEVNGATKTPQEHVKRIFEQNSPFAAQAIVWMSKYSTNDKLRYDASRYIVERAVGKVGDAYSDGDNTGSPLEKMLATFAKQSN